MRILLANKFYFPKGGTEVYVLNATAMLRSHGHEVVFFSMRHERNLPTDHSSFYVDTVDYNEPLSWPMKLRSASRILYSRHAGDKINALVEQTRPELAHVHNIYHQISPSILPVLKRRGLPVVMTVHDLKLLCPNYKMRTQGAICERCKPRRFYQAVLHRCVKDSLLASAVCAVESYFHRYSGVYETNVDKFITPSRFYQRKLVEWGISEKKIVSIPNFIRLERYVPLYGGEDYFVYVGRLSEEKGLFTLLESMRRLRRGTLFIVGDGPLYTDLQRLITECHLRNVYLTGPKWDAELASLIRGARFTVLASEWYENCPMSVIESYAYGKPVLGANIGGISEMIDDGRTGLLFEPFSVEDLAEKMDYLFTHHGAAAQMGKNARTKAEQEYNPEAQNSELMQVYSDVLGRESSRSIANV